MTSVADSSDAPLRIAGDKVVLTMSRGESRLLASSLTTGPSKGVWIDDLVHALRTADYNLTGGVNQGRGEFFHQLFAKEPALTDEVVFQARRHDAIAGAPAGGPSQMATLAAHALATTFEARSAMVLEVERLIALEALAAEVAVTVAAHRIEQAAAEAQDARAATTAAAAEAIVTTVTRTAADVKQRADASARRVAEAAALAAIVVQAALETPGADARATAAQIATIVASAAAADAVEAHTAALKVADDAISAAFEIATAAAEADATVQSAVGVAAEAAQADAHANASRVLATAQSRRTIADTEQR